MGYEYDIFLSYNRQHPHGTWVNEVLYPFLIPYVQDALNRKINVFKDDREILTGVEWEKTIMRALMKSRIMVSVLSPTYFMSEWCRREFQTIHYRQTQLGYMSDTNPKGIIVPLKLNDGDFFPNCVSKIQSLDCRDYFKTGEGFMKTIQFVELQDKLQKWSEDVANAVRISPEWSASWTENEWIENSKLIDLTTIESKLPPLL